MKSAPDPAVPKQPAGVMWFTLINMLLPLTMFHFAQARLHPSGLNYWFWVIMLPIYAAFCSLAIVRWLDRSGANRWWSVPVLSPSAVLLLMLLQHSAHYQSSIALILAIAAPWVLVLFTRRKYVDAAPFPGSGEPPA